MAAEMAPLFSAVKKAEPHTFTPIMRKASEYSRKPRTVMAYSSAS